MIDCIYICIYTYICVSWFMYCPHIGLPPIGLELFPFPHWKSWSPSLGGSETERPFLKEVTSTQMWASWIGASPGWDGTTPGAVYLMLLMVKNMEIIEITWYNLLGWQWILGPMVGHMGLLVGQPSATIHSFFFLRGVALNSPKTLNSPKKHISG